MSNRDGSSRVEMIDTPESVRKLADDIEHINVVFRDEEESIQEAFEGLHRYADLLEKTCRWQHDDLCGDYYTTECGNAHTFIDGGPKDNKQGWCGYCGGRIVEVKE